MSSHDAADDNGDPERARFIRLPAGETFDGQERVMSPAGPAAGGQGVTNEHAAGYANLTYGRVRTRRSCRPSSIRSLILTRPSCGPRSANWTP